MSAAAPAGTRGPAGDAGPLATARLFAGLKLRLLRNFLVGDPWRVVLYVVLALAVGTAGVLGAAGTAALRAAPVEVAGPAVTGVGVLLVAAWALLPVLLAADDDTVDPARFALLPLRPRTLGAGLLAASGVGVAPAATALVALATVVTWTRGLLPVALALVGATLGLATCLLVARTVVTAASAALGGRRGRETVGVLLVLGLSSIGLVPVLLTRALGALAETGDIDVLPRAAGALAWTPLGAAWSLPWTALTGSAWEVVARLGIALVTVPVLWLLYVAALARRLRTGGGSAATGRTRAGAGSAPQVLDRLLPDTRAGALTLRCLRYWRRDSRYLLAAATAPVVTALLLFLPLVAPVTVDDERPVYLTLAAGPVLAALLVLTMVNELAFDGTALWTSLAAGLPGRTERVARASALLVWALPVTAAVAVLGAVVAGRPHAIPTLAGLALGLLLSGVGVAALTSAVWTFPVAEAGASPFSSPTGTNAAAFLQQGAALLAGGVLALPLVALAAGSLALPALGWVLLAAGPLWGAAVLRVGTVLGGRRFDARGPELLAALRR